MEEPIVLRRHYSCIMSCMHKEFGKKAAVQNNKVAAQSLQDLTISLIYD